MTTLLVGGLYTLNTKTRAGRVETMAELMTLPGAELARHHSGIRRKSLNGFRLEGPRARIRLY